MEEGTCHISLVCGREEKEEAMATSFCLLKLDVDLIDGCSC